MMTTYICNLNNPLTLRRKQLIGQNVTLPDIIAINVKLIEKAI